METEVLGYKATCSAEKLKVAKRYSPLAEKSYISHPHQTKQEKSYGKR